MAQILRETPGGRLRPVSGGVTERLSDTIVLQRIGANEIRRVRFAALSYSAIWRISAAGRA